MATLPRLKPSVFSVLLALGAGEAMGAAGWDCQRGEDGKEWVCVAGKGKPSKPPAEEKTAKPPQEEAKPEPRREVARPAPPPPVEPARPAVEMARPVPAEEPARPPAEATRQAPAEPEQPAETVPAEEPSPPPAAAKRLEPPVMPAEPPLPVPAQAEEPSRPAAAKRLEPPVMPAEPPLPRPAQEQEPFPSKPAAPTAAVARPSETEVKLVQPKGGAEPAPAPTVGKPPQPSSGQAATTPAKTGWNCRGGAGKEWDCGLVGPDPRGEAHVVDAQGKPTENWSQSGDMTREDEQRFTTLLGHIPANPWVWGCSRGNRESTIGTEFLLSDADRLSRERSPLEIKSERAEMIKGEASSYEGSAELVRGDQRLFADFVTHNKESGALNAQGNVVYREKGLAFSSDTALMKLDTDEGILRNSQFIIETVPARGTSRVTHIDSKTKSRYETATYTTCPPGDQDWMLHATNASIDKDAGVGTATNAWLEFKGVPFLYTPFMSFPVDDRRRSGLLAPSIGYSQVNGFDFTQPYYLNLAPNYDLTLMPRILAKRGPMLRSDFRYLTETSSGRAFFDIVPYDEIRKQTRGQIGWFDNSRFNENISSHVDLHLVSDQRYIYELGNLLAVNSSGFLRSWGTLNYTGGTFLGGGYSAGMMVDYYQSLDPSLTGISFPYRRMPQFNFNYGRGISDTGLVFETAVEATRFDQRYKVNGERLNLRPRVYYPFRDTGGYITPSLALQHTEYWLHNLGPNEQSSFSRTAPIFSVDSGAYFERDFYLSDSPMQQTLEPRLFYLFVPKVNQPYEYNCVKGVGCSGLNFDAAEYDFNFYQLFRENRFAGVDRLSDANNITPALTSRLISQDSGLERLKLSVGKVFYLTPPTVTIVPNAPQTTVQNNVVSELSSMLSEHWSFRTIGQWNPSQGRIDRGQVILQYNNFANTLFNASYRYRRDPYAGSVPPLPINPFNPREINQTDVSARLPIGAGWFGIGRWQYDLYGQVTVQAMAGVEKETCCWRFSLVGLHYLNGVVTPGNTPGGNLSVPTNNAIFFQFELKGLGRFGDQMDTFLLQNLSGYRTDYDLPAYHP